MTHDWTASAILQMALCCDQDDAHKHATKRRRRLRRSSLFIRNLKSSTHTYRNTKRQHTGHGHRSGMARRGYGHLDTFGVVTSYLSHFSNKVPANCKVSALQPSTAYSGAASLGIAVCNASSSPPIVRLTVSPVSVLFLTCPNILPRSSKNQTVPNLKTHSGCLADAKSRTVRYSRGLPSCLPSFYRLLLEVLVRQGSEFAQKRTFPIWCFFFKVHRGVLLKLKMILFKQMVGGKNNFTTQKCHLPPSSTSLK